jgi:S-adenosylmethionine-diacylgycerolhomoserine-N-methlytransferase
MFQDVRTIFEMIKPQKGGDHFERLESFYKNQSENYDKFRKKLLLGRRHLYKQICELRPKGIWVDFGAGTGACLDYLTDEQIQAYDKIYLVDLSESLLKKAKEKIEARGLTNIETVASDILNFHPAEFCDIITFSYSLTMTPQWYKALDHSYNLLAPEGLIGVVDFYVSEKHPLPGLKHHDSMTRSFWPLFFSYDNVFINPDHLPYLLNKFEKKKLFEGEGRMPYFPMGKVPYYSFIGEKS